MMTASDVRDDVVIISIFQKIFRRFTENSAVTAMFVVWRSLSPRSVATPLFYNMQIYFWTSLTVRTHLQTVFLPADSKGQQKKQDNGPIF